MAKTLESLPSSFSAIISAWDSYAEVLQTFENLTSRLLREEKWLMQNDDVTTAFAALNVQKNYKIMKSQMSHSDEKRGNRGKLRKMFLLWLGVMAKRIDRYLGKILNLKDPLDNPKYPELTSLVKAIPELTHGNAHVDFSFLWGPINHLKHLFSRERLPFTAAYFGSLVATLYFALSVQSTPLTVLFAVAQVMALLWFLISYIPGGQTGLAFFTRLCSSAVTSTVSKTLPI
uniref:Vesicle transport protein n=1 Tax=Timema tahoe TaxID=61484 RepID=A0A7R9NU15_9NEOP|nr:unnamed protein product [Timema tahoe]